MTFNADGNSSKFYSRWSIDCAIHQFKWRSFSRSKIAMKRRIVVTALMKNIRLYAFIAGGGGPGGEGFFVRPLHHAVVTSYGDML